MSLLFGLYLLLSPLCQASGPDFLPDCLNDAGSDSVYDYGYGRYVGSVPAKTCGVHPDYSDQVSEELDTPITDATPLVQYPMYQVFGSAQSNN